MLRKKKQQEETERERDGEDSGSYEGGWVHTISVPAEDYVWSVEGSASKDPPKVSENWISATLLLTPIIATYTGLEREGTVDNATEKEAIEKCGSSSEEHHCS
ncbi:hypothetical protein MRB53_027866 [Persea americana]|uniref:Uncharacterized protein n=1 Tax=Persea americana TaxID=3435 RepID=A0ACC2KED9_PERAE|nr:hypothetical protein MRB53_027866 [Persea americana]